MVTENVSTIPGDYSSLQVWYDGVKGDLVGENRREIVELLGQEHEFQPLNMVNKGVKTSAECYFHIRPAMGVVNTKANWFSGSFAGLTNVPVIHFSGECLTASVDYTRIEGIVFTGHNLVIPLVQNYRIIYANAKNTIINRVGITDYWLRSPYDASIVGIYSITEGTLVTNCVINNLLCEEYSQNKEAFCIGISGDADHSTIRAYNCLVTNLRSTNVNDEFAGASHVWGLRWMLEAKNCIVGGLSGTGSSLDIQGFILGESPEDYCLSDDNTAVGANDIPNTALSSVIADTGSSTLDVHLLSSSMARGRGTDLSAIFTDDIDGEIRTLPWSIGPDQSSSSGVPVSDYVYGVGATPLAFYNDTGRTETSTSFISVPLPLVYDVVDDTDLIVDVTSYLGRLEYLILGGLPIRVSLVIDPVYNEFTRSYSKVFVPDVILVDSSTFAVTDPYSGESYLSSFGGRNLLVSSCAGRLYLEGARAQDATPGKVWRWSGMDMALGEHGEWLVRDSGYELADVDTDSRTGDSCFANFMFGSSIVTSARVHGEWYICLGS